MRVLVAVCPEGGVLHIPRDDLRDVLAEVAQIEARSATRPVLRAHLRKRLRDPGDRMRIAVLVLMVLIAASLPLRWPR